MIRKVLAASAAALALGLVGATGAGANPGFSQFCSANQDFSYSHGACVSFFESQQKSAAYAESLCKQFDVFFSNHGQCVSSFRENGFS